MWSSPQHQHNILQKIITRFEQTPPPTTTPYLFSNYYAAQSLLFAYVSQFDKTHPEKYAQQSVEALEEFMQVNSATIQAEVALAGRYLGAAWLLQHLANLDILDSEDTEMLTDLDEMIEDSLLENRQQKNYDTLYGLVSKGIYYLERLPHDSTAHTKLEQIVSFLDEFAIKKNGFAYWQDHFTKNKEHQHRVRYNLGLAHGILGMISFFGKACQHDILPHISYPLLEQSAHWLVQQESATYPGCFPHAIIEGVTEHSPSRLAWCYGDLCIVVALMHASQGLNQEHWKQKAIEIALKTAEKMSPYEAGVHLHPQDNLMDAGLCHGGGGIAHMYRKLYEATGHQAFQKMADHWLQLLVKQFQDEDTTGHYKRMKVNPDTKEQYWIEDYSFLEGYAGIALVLLGFLDNNTDTAWERALLLDF